MISLDSAIEMLQDKRVELLDQLEAIEKALAALKGTSGAHDGNPYTHQAKETPHSVEAVVPTFLKPKRILSDEHKQKLIEGRRRAREAKDVARGVAREPLEDAFVPALAQSADQLPRLVKRTESRTRELTIEPLAEERSSTREEAFVG